MSVTPTGRPAWSRTVTHEAYGGHVNKRDYQAQGVVNPQTDIGAAGYCRLVADGEATTRTSPMLVLTFRNNDTSPDAPTVISAYMMVGVSFAGYEGDAAPDSFPSGVRIGTGNATFTLDEEFLDAYGIPEAFAPTQVICSAQGSIFCNVTYEISGQDIEFHCFNAAGVALADQIVTVVAW